MIAKRKRTKWFKAGADSNSGTEEEDDGWDKS